MSEWESLTEKTRLSLQDRSKLIELMAQTNNTSEEFKKFAANGVILIEHDQCIKDGGSVIFERTGAVCTKCSSAG